SVSPWRLARPVTDEGYWSATHDARAICPNLDAVLKEERASGDVIGDASACVSIGLAPGTLFRNRLLDLLLADGLELLILRGAKNFLQLRRAFVVNGPKLSHLLHSGKGSIVLDCLEFWTLLLEDRQHLHFLLRRELKLLRQRLELRRRISGLARRCRREGQKRIQANGRRQERERFSH